MQKINLRELYPDIYKTDTFLEVADEVQAVFLADKRAEARYLRQMYNYIPERQMATKPMLSAICSASGMAWTPKSMRFPNWTACFRGRSPGRIFLLPSPICGIRSNPSMAVWPGLWASPATASRRNRNGKGGVDPWKNRKKSSSPWTAMSMGS